MEIATFIPHIFTFISCTYKIMKIGHFIKMILVNICYLSMKYLLPCRLELMYAILMFLMYSQK